MKKIWLFVGYDRHCDDTHHAFKTFQGACARADAFMADYGGRYEWKREVEYELEPQKVDTWAYRHSTFDDGPSVHVELIAFGDEE